MANWLQRVGCNYEDELLTTLEAGALPFEMMTAPLGTNDEGRLAFVGATDTGTGLASTAPTAPSPNVFRTPIQPIYEPLPAGLPKTVPVVPPGATPPPPRIIPPNVVMGLVGVVTVSGVAYTTHKLLTMTPEEAHDRQDRLTTQITPHVKPVNDPETERRTVARYCVAELMTDILENKTQALLFEAFDVGTEIHTDGEIADGPNQGKHICEIIPVYMPGDTTNTGNPFLQTANHIRESLGRRAPTTDPAEREGLIRNPFNMILTHGENPNADGTWYRRFDPCKPTPDNMACDEFPFKSTHQGGAVGGERFASLRPVPDIQSSPQGGEMSRFYGASYGCGVPKAPSAEVPNLVLYPASNFIVLPLPEGNGNSKFVCP